MYDKVNNIAYITDTLVFYFPGHIKLLFLILLNYFIESIISFYIIANNRLKLLYDTIIFKNRK